MSVTILTLIQVRQIGVTNMKIDHMWVIRCVWSDVDGRVSAPQTNTSRSLNVFSHLVELRLCLFSSSHYCLPLAIIWNHISVVSLTTPDTSWKDEERSNFPRRSSIEISSDCQTLPPMLQRSIKLKVSPWSLVLKYLCICEKFTIF